MGADVAAVSSDASLPRAAAAGTGVDAVTGVAAGAMYPDEGAARCSGCESPGQRSIEMRYKWLIAVNLPLGHLPDLFLSSLHCLLCSIL